MNYFEQKEYDRVLKQFDKQIKVDKSFMIDKELFILTYNFSLKDWNKIRTVDYWSSTKGLNTKQINIYTLRCVKNYINNRKD